jgi:hypothetical protein
MVGSIDNKSTQLNASLLDGGLKKDKRSTQRNTNLLDGGLKR